MRLARAELKRSITCLSSRPYLPRNGPLQTVRELLMVRGISRQLLFGTDVHQNGGLDIAGDNEPTSVAGDFDTGWAGLFDS